MNRLLQELEFGEGSVASKKKQVWSIGDIFVVPLKDGSECLGQVVGREPSVLNSVAIALFDAKGRWSQGEALPPLDMPNVFSALLATRDLLDSGRWIVLGKKAVGLAPEQRPYENLRESGFIGAKVRGSANVEEFVNAYYGLMPWDDWYVPNYLDDFLVSPDKKPHERLVFSGRHDS